MGYFEKENMWILGLLVLVLMIVSCPLAVADSRVPNMNDRIHLSPERSAHVMDSLKKVSDLFDKAEQNVKNNKADCEFYCPEGLRAVAKSNHKVYPDGCGSPDNKFDLPIIPEIDKCCDDHDICYGTFGKEKKTCDKNLHKCLQVSCTSAMKSLGYTNVQGCKMMSKLLLNSLMSSSCEDYKTSQEKATICQAEKEKEEQEESDKNSSCEDYKKSQEKATICQAEKEKEEQEESDKNSSCEDYKKSHEKATICHTEKENEEQEESDKNFNKMDRVMKVNHEELEDEDNDFVQVEVEDDDDGLDYLLNVDIKRKDEL